MGKVVKELKGFKRKKGHLYYVKGNKVMEAKMKRKK